MSNRGAGTRACRAETHLGACGRQQHRSASARVPAPRLLAGLFLTLAAFGQDAPPSNEPLFRAMRDELARSRQLSIPNLESPYYIEYGIDEQETFSAAASLGGLLSQKRERFRTPFIFVRVGDYKFDNSNFGGGRGSAYDLEAFPIENSYPVLRRYLWLETDSAYKGAVEAISRKRAANRNVNQNDRIDDFAHAEPLHFIRDFKPLVVDESSWANRIRSLSGIFTKFPEIQESSVDLEVTEGGHYLENSEGTEVKTPESVTMVRARASAQAPDGSTVRDFAFFHALDPKAMVDEADMTREVTTMAQNLVAMAHAPKGEDYNGPVLFEGQASAQLFAQILGENLTLVRRPEGGRGAGAPPGDLDGRVGARVLPESFDVVDDPSLKEYKGKTLFGGYEVDREGVPAKRLQIVEKGIFKNFLLTRQPVKGYEGSNGRARYPAGGGTSAAGISNLIVTSSETVPAGEMKKKLLDLLQSRNKPYGIIIRKLDFPSTASLEEARRVASAQQGAAHPVSVPLLIYKVYTDGHEELVRGVQFHGLTARSLRDILMAGDDAAELDFMDSPAPFDLIGLSNFTMEASVVAPSVLIDELELRPTDDEQPKLPLVPAPEISH